MVRIEKYKTRLVKLATKRAGMARAMGHIVDVDDLVQAGYVGLMLAQKRYDSEKGRFWNYAAIYAIREMREAIWKQCAVMPRKLSHDIPPLQAGVFLE